MCSYCKPDIESNDDIILTDCGEVRVWIVGDQLKVQYDDYINMGMDTWGKTEELDFFTINYCPMCGRKL